MAPGVLKVIVVVALLGSGGVFLANGLGAGIPFLKYENLEVWGIPAWAILIAAGILLAVFWKVSSKQVVTTSETEVETFSDGVSSTTITTTTDKTVEITTTMTPPRP